MSQKIKCKLERCTEIFTPTNSGHVFHSDKCRAEYHRTHIPGTGTVNGMRLLKNGDWSITVHLHEQPQLKVGSKIALVRARTQPKQKTQ